ncbi:M10 family metallopeptidase C-terminal domain-containing protein [Microvirga sp. ACRRW]|uniref:M10 family metallopeptidase n=1 Tax=Microvirga sp. ACRRW TaxID=2918205 RepID=UPI001EF47EF0|nr:M10 family metallopeptidase [Microvirga sp. ACRRW]MCG7392775.1 M10 family metallopeptidase C-terminal domain-containing protein [Microvirga sp. ACRRW]
MANSGRIVPKTGDANIDGILGGKAWYLTTISYGFPTSAAFYGTTSEYGAPEGYATKGFTAASEGVKQAFRAILEGLPPTDVGPKMMLMPVEGFTNLNFTEVDQLDNPLIAIAKTSGISTAAGYYPSDDTPSAGDIWIGTKYAGFDTSYLAQYYYFTTMHEIGHALGLKHGHEARTSTEVPLPAERDSIEFSVMTYRSYVGAELTGNYLTDPYSFAQTYMMNDIAALQLMYGANFNFRSDDTVYSWSPTTGETLVNGAGQGVPGRPTEPSRSNKIFLTIWDGGGNDTYDLSLYETDLQVDLRPGASSLFSTTQLAHLDYRNTDHPARGNVFNALLYDNDPRSLIENAIGGSGHDTIIGNAGDNRLSGRDGNDSMEGGAGDDIFDGGLGADTMAGGKDDDVYYVDDAGDLVVESAGFGNDLVYSSIDHALSANVERLSALGAAGIRLTGNALDNRISGNAGDNVINGGAGADTMAGGEGDDTFIVDDAGDVVSDISGNDTVRSSISYTLDKSIENLTATGGAALALTGNELSNVLTGNAAANTLSGQAGNDVLDGGAGADTMTGGTGNDTYYVDDLGDMIVEVSGGGSDSVFTSVSYSLSKHVENLNATGTSNITLTGNEANNALTGNGAANVLRGGLGNDTLNGGGGKDRLEGGAGNDIYYVDNAKDVVVEAFNGGKDKVYTTVSYKLAAHVETLIATGTRAVALTGNGTNNTLTGNSTANKLSGLTGNDALNGGLGNDRLTGGAGRDKFIFSTKLNARSNMDTITDFSVEDDRICLENAIFKKLGKTGALKDAFFRIGSKALDANDYLIYNPNTGVLSYDADGSGKGAAIRFAKLKSQLALSAQDFLVV